MKIKLILALFLLPVCLIAQPFDYEIRGTIKNYQPGQKMYFVHFENGKAIDSSPIVNGSFSFKGNADLSNEPDEHLSQSLAQLYVVAKGKHIDFKNLSNDKLNNLSHIKLYLQPGVTNISITSSALGAKVMPSLGNTEYYQLDSINKVKNDKIIAFNKHKNIYDAKEDIKQPYYDQRVAIDDDHHKAVFQMIMDNPSSPVSLLIIKYHSPLDAKYEDIAPYYQALSPQLKQTKSGQRIAGYLDRISAVQVGKPAPDFIMNDPAGKPVSLTNYKGKYVILDFWASWCGPCREDNPDFLALYKKFKGQNFDIIGVSLDNDLKDWKQAIAKDHLPWTHISDLNLWENAVAKLYAVRYVPQKYLIDPQGQIIARGTSTRDLERMLTEIFSNRAK